MPFHGEVTKPNVYSYLLVHTRKLLSEDEVDTSDLFEDGPNFSEVLVEVLKLLGHHVHPFLRDVKVDQKKCFKINQHHCSHIEWGPKIFLMGTQFLAKW